MIHKLMHELEHPQAVVSGESWGQSLAGAGGRLFIHLFTRVEIPKIGNQGIEALSRNDYRGVRRRKEYFQLSENRTWLSPRCVKDSPVNAGTPLLDLRRNESFLWKVRPHLLVWTGLMGFQLIILGTCLLFIL